MNKVCDLFIIGGGINGTAIAADAAGRGLSVILCDKNDLAAGTSSASSKLIHGGLRYLETYEFSMVKKALLERNILMRRASNIIEPIEFILPYTKHLRPAWLIRLGLFLYDHLSKKNNLPRSKMLSIKSTLYSEALLPHFKKGFSYYDGFTDDARLVILNALLAKKQGAEIETYVQFISAEKDQGLWKINLKNIFSQKTMIYYAKALINVAGPWIGDVQQHIFPSLSLDFKLIKGSHIITSRLYEGNFAYILQCPDKRVVFTIPYQQYYTLIGTTDILFSNDLDHITITLEEEKYLCDVINKYFKKPITTKNILNSYAGVRCLQKMESKNISRITRDYKILINDNSDLPQLTIIGGKLTTHRWLAEETVNLLKNFFPKMKAAWTANHPLPGCDFGSLEFAGFYQQFNNEYPWLPEAIAHRYVKNYGTNVYQILKNKNSLMDLGVNFGGGLYQCELEYLITNEWVKTSEDILWRRTKLGLVFTENEVKKLKNWLAEREISK